MDFIERDTVSGEQGTTKESDQTAINLQKDKEVKLKMCFPSYRTFYVDKEFKSERAYSRNEHNCTPASAVVVKILEVTLMKYFSRVRTVG